MKELLCKVWKKEWTEEDKLIIMIMMAALGIIIGLTFGFILSPVKKGLNMFSGNGCGNENTTKIKPGKKDKKK